LEKGNDEHLAPLSATDGVQAVLAQVYRLPSREMEPAVLLTRGASLAMGPPALQRVTFRRHSDAGRYWAERLGWKGLGRTSRAGLRPAGRERAPGSAGWAPACGPCSSRGTRWRSSAVAWPTSREARSLFFGKRAEH